MSNTIIGLTGKAGTGKSTVSLELVRLYGFTRLAFADPLKSMLEVFLNAWGMSEPLIKRHIDGDLKEQPCEALQGSSCRYALQTLGTEWGRYRINPALWVKHLGHRILNLPPEQRDRVVIDDVRMDNEAEYLIANFGARIWTVAPLAHARRDPPSHASEKGLDRTLIHDVIQHDFTMNGLDNLLAMLMEDLNIDRRGVWAS